MCVQYQTYSLLLQTSTLFSRKFISKLVFLFRWKEMEKIFSPITYVFIVYLGRRRRKKAKNISVFSDSWGITNFIEFKVLKWKFCCFRFFELLNAMDCFLWLLCEIYLLFSSGFGFDCFLRDIMIYTRKIHLNLELKCSRAFELLLCFHLVGFVGAIGNLFVNLQRSFFFL